MVGKMRILLICESEGIEGFWRCRYIQPFLCFVGPVCRYYSMAASWEWEGRKGRGRARMYA